MQWHVRSDLHECERGQCGVNTVTEQSSRLSHYHTTLIPIYSVHYYRPDILHHPYPPIAPTPCPSHTRPAGLLSLPLCADSPHWCSSLPRYPDGTDRVRGCE